MRIHFKFLFLIVALSLSACGGLVNEDVALKTPVMPPEDARPSPVGFNKIRFAIPTGTPLISSSPKGPVDFIACDFPYGVVESGISSRSFPDDNYRRIFLNTLEGQGYDVAGDPGRMFDEQEDLMRAVYSVGARVTDLKMDLCRKSNLFGTYRGETGEAVITIEWTVFDLLNRKNAYKTVTKGYAAHRLPNYEAVPLLLEKAFAAAVHNLGADQAFHNLVFAGLPPEVLPDTVEDPYEEPISLFDPRERVEIRNPPLAAGEFQPKFEDIARTAVLIQAAQSHGSGFFITERGHILTNAHVVGNARRVRVVTSGKQEKMIAEVLRVDRRRDVALLKLEDLPPALEIQTLPIRLDKPAIGEEVYAIGTPGYKRLQDTVTKGIISAHRTDRRTGLPEIQADVTVHGGSSGGPLLDAHGNIIGLSVSGYRDNSSTLAGLNTFIPIGGALAKLDIFITH